MATGKKDASGHTIYGDIGVYLRDTLNAYLKPRGGRTFYIDPSYIIRSVPPTPLGRSMRMMSAPMSDSSMVQNGPGPMLANSTTRTPESGPPLIQPARDA